MFFLTAFTGFSQTKDISDEIKKVLIISSYHKGNQWTDVLVQGEEEAIDSVFPEARFLFEYLDLKRFPDISRNENILADLLHKKQYFEPDIILINDNSAYDLIQKNRAMLFPDIPIVFAGYNGFVANMMNNPPENTTGVAENLDPLSTVELALKLHPETKIIFIVLDLMPSSREIKRELNALIDQFNGEVIFTYLDHLDMPEIIEKVSHAPDDSIVLMPVYNRDRDGTFYDHTEAAHLVAKASSVPVYHLFSFALGEGVIGGYMLDGKLHGQQAGKLAVRILQGERASEISPLPYSLCPPMFDDEILKKWEIPHKALPSGAIIVNQKTSFREKNSTMIRISSIVFLFLSLVIIHLLSILYIHRHKQDQEENFRVILSSIGDGVIATNTKGQITQMNRIAQIMTGWTLESAIGLPLEKVFVIIDPLTREKDNNPVHEILSSEQNKEVTSKTTLISHNGQEYPITDSAAPIRNERKEFLGVVLVFRDMTKENDLQEKLRQSEKMTAIGQLAGGVAHDFNNMLSGILGSAELLEEYVSENKQAEMLRTLIVHSSERASGLIQKLLTFARKQPILLKETDLHSTIMDSLVILQNTIDKKIEIKPELMAQSYTVFGDILQIQNALLNLGINASQSMPEGGLIRISTRVERLTERDCQNSMFDLTPGEYLEVRVEDTGKGIPPENISRIFEPFFTTKNEGKGTGLGLSAVYGTVEQHHGSIEVSSIVGIGSVFTVRLPLYIQESKPESNDSKNLTPGMVTI